MLEVLDANVGAWVDAALVAVLPAHEVGRRATIAEDLDDLAVPGLVADPVARDEEPVARRGPKVGA